MAIPEFQTFEEGTIGVKDGVVTITGEFGPGSMGLTFASIAEELFSPDMVPPISMIDLSDTHFIDSRGLRCLLRGVQYKKQQQEKLGIRGNVEINRLLEITGTAELFEVEKTPGEV